MTSVALGLDAGRSTGWAVLQVERQGVAIYHAHGVLGRDDRETELRALLAKFRPVVIGVEIPRGQHYAGRHVAVAHLIEAATIGANLAGLAVGLGCDARLVTAAETRKAFCGRANGGDKDVERILRLRCPSWPKRSSNHARDAAFAALFVALRAAREAA